MDLKKDRRDAAVTGKWTDRDLPQVEGMYPGAGGYADRKGQGTAASDNNVGWDIRSQSWQRGADTDCMAIQKEKDEQDKRFGVPCDDNFPAPSDPAGPKNCGARYQTASYNADETLPSPANFSSNPGFMGTSTSDMARITVPGFGGGAPTRGGGSMPSPARRLPSPIADGGRRETSGGVSGRAGTLGGSTIGRSSRLSRGNVSLPAPGDVDPGSEGSPQVMTSGFANG